MSEMILLTDVALAGSALFVVVCMIVGKFKNL